MHQGIVDFLEPHAMFSKMEGWPSRLILDICKDTIHLEIDSDLRVRIDVELHRGSQSFQDRRHLNGIVDPRQRLAVGTRDPSSFWQ